MSSLPKCLSLSCTLALVILLLLYLCRQIDVGTLGFLQIDIVYPDSIYVIVLPNCVQKCLVLKG